MNALSLDTVVLADNKKEMIILDQTLLPGEIKYLTLSKAEDIWEAIYALRVRGAPAIGVAAGYGIYIVASQLETDDMDAFVKNFKEKKAYLDSSRPTAVNLSWALNRMEKVLEENRDKLTVAQMKERLCQEADAIREEDIAISRSIGNLGFELLHHGDGILTHCNAGTLATAKYGTALAPVYIALEHGWDDLHVFCDETRPLLQGARLSAFEMQTAGVDTTLICDHHEARQDQYCVCRLRPRRFERRLCQQDRHERRGDSRQALWHSVLRLRAVLHDRHVAEKRR